MNIINVHAPTEHAPIVAQIIKVMCPTGWQIFWNSGARSGVHKTRQQAMDAIDVAVPMCRFDDKTLPEVIR